MNEYSKYMCEREEIINNLLEYLKDSSRLAEFLSEEYKLLEKEIDLGKIYSTDYLNRIYNITESLCNCFEYTFKVINKIEEYDKKIDEVVKR